MFSCVFSRHRTKAVIFLFFLIILALSPVQGEWNSKRFDDNRLSLDTIWGTSDDNIYAISFAGKVFHKDAAGWTDISPLLFSDASDKIYYLPYGVWGTAWDNVYITGSRIDTDLGDNALMMGTPFVFQFNGSEWKKINLSKEAAYRMEGPDPAPGEEDERTGKFYPNWIAGIWGTSKNDIYFTGGKFTGELNLGDPVTGGIVLHYSEATKTWKGEVGVGDFLNDNYTDPVTDPMPMINEMTGINGHIYAVGLKGLILHKNISADYWEIMPVDSTTLNFFRTWAAHDDDVFAAGFSSSSSAGVIYRYNGIKWTAMTMPNTSGRFGYIAAIWGIWGENSSKVHAVGNAGASIYYDGNEGNTWKQMISDTTTSLNSVWGTSFNNVYASGEDGRLYHFTEGIKTSSLNAYPRHSVAPSSVEFTDISIDEIKSWEWDFGDTTASKVSPVADLDYKILVTAIEGSSMNGARIVIRSNTGNVTGESVDSVEAVSAVADLGGSSSDSLIKVTAKPGKKANQYSIHVLPTAETEDAAIHFYEAGIYLKVNSGTTLGEMADLLESLDDLIKSAVPVDYNARWFASNPSSSYAEFDGGQNYTINLRIDSGKSTQQNMADVLKTHEKILDAVPDEPSKIWIRGLEQVSNIATFSGGLDDSNFYMNDDKTISDYYTAKHIYKKPGTYTAKLTINRPDIPATAEIIVKETQRPDVLTYNQGVFLVSTPGTAINGVNVSIADGGPGTEPSIDWTNRDITVTVDSGVTTQMEVANLFLTHPLILGAVTSEPYAPWYSSNGSDNSKFYNGLWHSKEISDITVTVFNENPLDFTLTPAEGTKQVTATFRENASPDIKNKIVRWVWYFNYESYLNPGNSQDGSILSIYDPNRPVAYTYDRLGTYNVKLSVILDDESPFECYKEKAITVKSSDEGKSSFKGGSGLDNAGGCFINSMW